MKNHQNKNSHFNNLLIKDIEFDNSIIEASIKAKMAVERGEKNIFNATIGSLFDENNNFFIFDSVFELFNKNVSNKVKASYCPSIDGGLEFSNITKKWLFKNNDFLFENSYVCASPGGSGSLSSIVNTILSDEWVILIPDYTWDPMILMSKKANLKIYEFKMFNENHKFYLDDLFKKIDSLKNQYKKIAIYLNDPVHNPTSFSMNKNHWDNIVFKLNENFNNEFVIINDVAYIEFSLDEKNSYMEAFRNINNNILLFFCVSYSKSLTFYGLRLGASIVYHKDKIVTKKIHDLLIIHARANWSNSNHGAIETVIQLNKNKDFYLVEKEKIVSILKSRFNHFINECIKNNLNFIETSIGFFITIPLEKNIIKEFVLELNKLNIFVVPIKKGIRIGICSLTINQCKLLPAILKKTLDKVTNNEG